MARKDEAGLVRYLTPLGAWALSFGCSVGWGSFVMPGSTFLPVAGPVGTVIGIFVGALVMLVIGMSYQYLMSRYPDAGGTYSFAKNCFNYDHGFLCAWFLVLCYVAFIWANATALPLIARRVLGGLFQVGLHYQIAGFDIYLGEVGLAVASLVGAALICMRNRVVSFAQIAMATLLLAGVTVVFVLAVGGSDFAQATAPAFAPDSKPWQGVMTVVALAPWAYVGFESICHSTQEFNFDRKKSFKIMVVAIVAAAVAYALLALLAVLALPEGCATWYDYISNLGSYDGMAGLPTFFAADTLLGRVGTTLLGLAAFGGIVTGLVGNFVASSRLLYALAKDDMLPAWFGKVDDARVPRNAILFLLGISVILPFFGRTAISWIVDVTTVGATIAYAYAAAAALKTARRNDDKPMIVVGGVGLAISLLFAFCFLAPNLLAITTLSDESYLILAGWGILGFLFFLYLFKRDDAHRLGHSTVTWVVLLALIIFTSTVWVRQETVAEAVSASDHLQTLGASAASWEGSATIEDALHGVSDVATRNILIQTWLIVVALAILFQIYSLMQKRERQLEVEKALAEESNRAKTSFLSNMSHEIRTPMNAIIGLDSIALKDPDLPPRTRDQLEKIGASARHLLGLINDILDMSRIESGRMVLKDEEFALGEFLEQINIIINGQCADKGLDYECHVIGSVDDYYIGDDMKLKQVLINILGNAVKFTDSPGTVKFTVEQVAQFEGHRTMRFVMADTGVGMSKEYIPKIFDAFSQENGSVTNKYGSTGLGMAITKSIVDMMNGDIEVESEKGVGTTFTVTVTLRASNRSVQREHCDNHLEGMRVLVVDNDEVACEHAQLVANAIGMVADYTLSGQDALDMVMRAREQGDPYGLVISDYKMPGMDGVDLAQQLHAFDGGETAVIILTGYNVDDMEDEAKAAGVDAVMAKPLFTDNLLRQVHVVFDHRGKAAAVAASSEGSSPDSGLGDLAALVEPVESQEEMGSLEGLRVLIAEDFEINAEILIDILDMEGIEADHAENGQEAVDMFSASESGYYDAILMDVRMPVLDGLGATRAIRELDREDAQTIPIIALTANAFDEDVQRSLQSGMSAHLSKPVEPDRLFETLGALVRAS